jgi:hypothetical protein
MPDNDIPPARTVEYHPVQTRGPRSRKPLIVAAYVVAVAGIILAQVLVSKAYSTPARAAAAPSPGTRQSAPARVPGWHAVVGDTGTIAYDVPPGWAVSDIGAGKQLHDGTWQLAMTMLAGPTNDRCTGSGAGTVPQPDTAAQTAQHVANAVYGPGTVRVDPPRTVTDDGITGQLVTAHVTGCGSAALVDVFALPNPARHQSVVLIAFSDTVDQHDLDTIVTSVRQLPAH